ncbi:MAG: PilZ domain-containing protein [Myxococcota bacterium]
MSVRISTVDAETDPDSGAPFFRSAEATTANLSRGGAFVHSWEPLAAGRRVIVALDLPAGGELQLVGRVVWTRRRLEGDASGSFETPGYGIEFIERTRSDQAALQQILDASSAITAPASASNASASSSAPSTSAPSVVRPLTGPPA